VAAGFFACASPDLDFVIGFLGPVAYLQHHRGVTHSLLLLPLWAFGVAWVLSKILRAPGGWRELYGVAALGIGLHIAGDWITGFGTMMLAPFSDWRAAIGTTFIIDLWFSGIILAGLLVSVLFRKSRMPAVVASAILVGYVGFQYLQKQEAIGFGEAYAKERGLPQAEISAHPRPVSPFNWTVFVTDAETQRFAHVNLVRKDILTYREGDGFVRRLDAAYRPLEQALWESRSRYGEKGEAREAWNAPALAVYRWFADHPSYDGTAPGTGCHWFVDLRFLTPGRAAMPFRYGACRDAAGEPWRLAVPAD
jgi:inner membrane protein